MATAKKTAKKVAAKKAPVAKPDVDAAVDANLADRSEEELANIETLKEAGVKLKGTETAEELAEKVAALEEGEETEEAEEDEDLPNKMAPRFEIVKIDNKDKRFFIHFVARAGSKCALYNENGVRISPVVEADAEVPDSEPSMKWGSRLAKNAARNNAIRRRSMVPADYANAPKEVQ